MGAIREAYAQDFRALKDLTAKHEQKEKKKL